MKEIYAFGCGEYFLKKQESILKEFEILGIFDNYKTGSFQLINKKIVPIINPDKKTVKGKKIIITISDFLTVWEQLIEFELSTEDIIFSYKLEPLFAEEQKLFSKNEYIEIIGKHLYYINQHQEQFLIKNKKDLFDVPKKEERRDIDGAFINTACPLNPLNRTFGFSRGMPIDRYYIEKFLDENKNLIFGDVLEIAENTYTFKYGGDKVRKSHILYINDDDNIKKDIVGNFETGEGIEEEMMDCIILTQILPFIYNTQKAIKNIYKMLKEHGTALITVNGISQISRYDMDRWGHYWNFTDMSMQRLLETVVPKDNIKIQTFGNVKAATALLYGLAVEDMAEDSLDVWDKDYQISICAILKKEES